MAQVPFSLAKLSTLAAAYFDTAPNPAALEFEPMPGGASTRQFVRVRYAGTAGRRSAVGMFFPDAATPEEVTSGAAPTRWPFLEVQSLLHARNVRVPALYAEDCPSGWILVEDLGDVTLAAALEANPSAKTGLYQLAVRDLARAQVALQDAPASSVVQQRSFTEALLRWEVDHFREYGLEARGIVLSDTQRSAFDAGAHYLTAQVAQLEYAVVHRDYQSRNLMVLGDAATPELGWVDFQDALLGPCVYDLVALLNDSYQSFTPEFVADRLREFAEHRALSPKAAAGMQREFDLVTVQRKLKDAGRFVFIERKKGDSSFLRFIQPTLERVTSALSRLSDDPQLASFSVLLDEVLAGQ